MLKIKNDSAGEVCEVKRITCLIPLQYILPRESQILGVNTNIIL